MKKFFIIANRIKDPNLAVAGAIRKKLHELGRECVIQELAHADGEDGYKYTDPAQVPGDADCVLVLGGDGTMLQASRDLVTRNIPMFGINLGTLGYLAEIGKEDMEQALEKLAADEYLLEERMMLEGTVFYGGVRALTDVALNDIVISRSGKLRVMDYHIYVNDRFLNSYSADGIIVSTPTGSTGYNLSAGGPIVSPSASMILITPIAPHTLTARSVILPDDVTVKIEIGERTGNDESAEATFDGDSRIEMKCRDYIEIRKSDRTVQFVKIDQVSFLEILRKKMSGA
ncbi:NAD(+)/NADH kinase [Marvinbryantia formatexigens DSM 14469]|uniref:NAD kinase n=1 Tax=Marvinbryantia formatexigens DSM 14469 TaxID=478749 RepID=C6LLG6_9FIRM|nr:NAD(+)/NADH kinase [Marvinbryantia formatexigens]EET58506.1 NAD(+)/NADH kinase [Marvinbryantia formatexigens DSM 14469]UWO24921.1 NAD(+)/NADH kinase [Marvinbryantia formatexigens DSM 14469]SDH14917.1 NAD+ kinase [Marvinbryantia formatexigens]